MKIPVLLVNDSADDQALLLRAIERTELRIEAIAQDNCLSALHWLQHCEQTGHNTPALIVLDLATPQIDGVGFLQRLRADSQTRNIPVVVYSGNEDSSTIDACFACGCNSYVHKPIRYAEFTEAVHLIIRYWLNANCFAHNRISTLPPRKNRA